MKSIGKTAEDLGGANQPVLYFSAAILQLLIASVLAAAIGWAGASRSGRSFGSVWARPLWR